MENAVKTSGQAVVKASRENGLKFVEDGGAFLDAQRLSAAREATYEMDALIGAVLKIVAALELGDGSDYLLRGLMSRVHQLNSTLMAAISDEYEPLLRLQHVIHVVPCGVH